MQHLLSESNQARLLKVLFIFSAAKLTAKFAGCLATWNTGRCSDCAQLSRGRMEIEWKVGRNKRRFLFAWIPFPSFPDTSIVVINCFRGELVANISKRLISAATATYLLSRFIPTDFIVVTDHCTLTGCLVLSGVVSVAWLIRAASFGLVPDRGHCRGRRSASIFFPIQ
ncbi:hypothetical protein T10_11830 [Trichinella papuae]|uniref:Uncharacterized protein n=1 Tax=Trichinella papuae TaxID=268474 RepID=A0A0V1MCF3_9BILA|nr:hypothetical protein T10_11830 [Trichinella papuae]